jgi:hypothetical protein
MRATDDRYTAERDRFDLAIRMIRHEARTGTIRLCTGFTEDRIRKIYTSYFPNCGHSPGHDGGQLVRRRRGKTPSQIAPFVNTAHRQGEASLIAGLLVHSRVAEVDASGRGLRAVNVPRDVMGCRFCDAYEAYLHLHPQPQLSFEWAWNLHMSLVQTHELQLAWCALCEGPYVRDAYALDYERCPFCEVKDHA